MSDETLHIAVMVALQMFMASLFTIILGWFATVTLCVMFVGLILYATFRNEDKEPGTP